MLEKLDNEIKNALKNGEKDRLTTLRMLKGEVKLNSINNKKDITDDDILNVVTKQIKNLKASIEEFEKGGRKDLIDKSNAEITILSEFLPEQLSDTELDKMIDDAFSRVNPTSPKDMGKVMGMITPLVRGKADMNIVSQKIKSRLNN